MHLLRGLERSRCWAPHLGVQSAAYIYDPGKAQQGKSMRPAGDREWWRSPAGVWHAVSDLLHAERGSLSGSQQTPTPWLGVGTINSIAQATTALSNAYTFNSAGNAVASVGATTSNKTISDFYNWIESFTGTAGLVTDVDWEIRTDASTTTSYKPSTAAALGSGSFNPGGNTGWHRAGTGLSISTTAQVPIWSIIGDANGNGTNFANVSRGGTDTLYATQANNYSIWSSLTTTTGFNTTATVQARVGPHVLVFSDGSAAGNPYHTITAQTLQTVQCGLHIGSLTETLKIYAFGSTRAAASQPVGIKAYEGTAGPSSSHSATGTQPMLNGMQQFYLSSVYTAPKATVLRLVLYISSSNYTAPQKIGVGTVNSGTAADIAKAFPGNGNYYYAKESGGTWGGDDSVSQPDFYVWIDDQVAVSPPAPTGASLSRVFTGQ